MTCKYKNNNKPCDGKARLRRIIRNGGEGEYIIGCDKWVKGERFHRYIKVPKEIDLELLQNIFQGRNVYLYIYIIYINFLIL